MIAVIDYDAGNLMSITNALQFLKADFEVIVSPRDLKRYSKIIFPGVGAAGAALDILRKRNFITPLRNTKVPFLGICLGMQLLFTSLEEDNETGLKIVPQGVCRLPTQRVKVPHIGWNIVKQCGASPILKNIPDESAFYFVHSFAPELSEYTLGISHHGTPFTAIVQKNNFFGTQFHPEKSGSIGLRLLQNFLAL